MPVPDESQNVLGAPSASDADIDSLFAQPSAQKTDSDIDALFGGASSANFNAAQAFGDPDGAAKARSLSASTGLPPEAAEAAFDVLESAQQQYDIDALFADNPATQTFFNNASNARIAYDSVEQLGIIERLVRGFERGQLTTELGFLGAEARGRMQAGDILDDDRVRIKELQDELQALGEDNEGFVSWLAGVSEFLGQRVSSVSERTATAGLAGGSLGAAAGLAGGPLAPVTSTVGSAVGFVSGIISDQAMAIAETEGGLSFVEQLGEGVDPETARLLSFGVGIINAGLETVGGASFLRPLTEAGKKAFREGLRGIASNPEVRKALGDFAVNYALNVGTEVTTEVMQEMVNIAAEELGKEITDGTAAEWTPDEWTERLSKIAVKTFKTSVLLAAPGNVTALAQDARRIRKAQRDAKQMSDLQKELEQSVVAQRSPEAAADHATEAFANQDIREVYIPSAELAKVAAQQPDPEQFYASLGVSSQVEAAQAFDGDVQVSVRTFTRDVLLQPDRYAALRDHIKVDPDGLTAAEAKEQASAAGLMVRTITDKPPQAIDLAEHELGLQILYQSGKDAGMTDKQHQSYLAAYQAQREQAAANIERQKLKREQKKNEAEYKAREAEVAEAQRDRVAQEPLYQAQLSIGATRLSYDEVLEIFDGNVEAIKQLPKVNGQRMVAPKGEKGLSPWALADIYGFEGGDVLLYQFLDNPTFEEAVQQRTDATMQQEFGTLLDERQRIEEALQALHVVTDFTSILVTEYNQLRQAKKNKRLKKSAIVARARQMLAGYKISEINVSNLEAIQRREARKAAKAVRAGNVQEAAQAKYNQAIAYQMAREAYKARDEVQRGNKYLKRFLSDKKRPKALPIDYLEAIRDVLAGYQFGARLSDKKRQKLEDWVQTQAQQGVFVEIPKEIADANGSVNYQDLTLDGWRQLYQVVRNLDKQGRDENKLRHVEEARTRQEIADEIAEGINDNLSSQALRQANAVSEVTDIGRMTTLLTNVAEAKRKFKANVSNILLNADSLLRAIDGFKDLGTAYRYIKGGIDRAITEGYQPDQIGYTARLKKEAQELNKLFDLFTAKERARMHRQQDIPGVRTRLSRSEQIAVLLNMGNAENRQALLGAKRADGSQQFTEAELEAIVNNASERDLQFVQGVWDYFETLWPDIRASVRRRQNREPVRVAPLALETKFGTYRGGYYPLRYDTSESIVEGNVTVDEARGRLLFGGFIGSHTRNGHTKTREGSAERAVKLDPFVINNHVQEVVYDLEVGDAVTDAYKILHHKTVKQAFSDNGQKAIWDALDTWLGDVTTGEIHRAAFIERGLRRLRTGVTISALGLNLSVALLQPLGLIQSSVQVGKPYMLRALWDVISSPVAQRDILAPYKLMQEVTEQSGFMRERERSFNKDIQDAQRGLRASFLEANTPGRTDRFISDSLFVFIAKAQRVVDFVTWIAAKRRGLEQFDGDDAKSTEFADRMVARTQGSGNFQERTAFERGTLSKDIRQTELIKAWSLFLNYFAAKLNVAYERTTTTRFRNPLQAAHWAVDMALLFFVEGLLATVIREGLPSDDDDDGSLADDFAWTAAWEGVKGFSAGIPIVRELTSRAEGFATGGSIGSVIDKGARAAEQISQGELDKALVTSVNSVLGVLFQYPTSQINKAISAFHEDMQGEDVGLIDYIMGPTYSK